MATDTGTLKRWFGRGQYPTAEQFAALIDSFVHKGGDAIGIGDVAGLADALNGRYSSAAGAELERRYEELADSVGAHVDASSRKLVLHEGMLGVLYDAATKAWQMLVPGVSDVDDGDGGELTEAISKLEGLGAAYGSLWALANTVKTFMEAEGVADGAIDKWREVVDFLSGIEDTGTLGGILAGLQGSLTELETAVGNKVSKEAGKGLVSDKERARWNSARMYALDGVCADRASLPGYGIWAFKEDGGVWTIDGDFASAGMTREDYCDKVGIDMGRYVPKAHNIYICSCYEPKCSRLYYVDVEDGYALKQFVTDRDLPKEHAVEVATCATAGTDRYTATLSADYNGVKGIKVGDTVRLTGNTSYAFGVFTLPHLVTGVKDAGSLLKVQVLHMDEGTVYAMTISVGDTARAYIREL